MHDDVLKKNMYDDVRAKEFLCDFERVTFWQENAPLCVYPLRFSGTFAVQDIFFVCLTDNLL
jgi:hypothetical protein